MEVILLPIILWILFSMFAADVGKKRIIGYWSVFWLSIILSPVIGLIIALMSPSEVKVVVSKSENESTGSQKICPDCAEDVKEAALKCKHCGYRWS